MAAQRSGILNISAASSTLSLADGLVERWKAVVVVARVRYGFTALGMQPHTSAQAVAK